MSEDPLRTDRIATYPADVGVLPEARHQVMDWGASAALHPDLFPDVEVVTSELVANAIHASPPGERIHVGVSAGCPGICLEVANLVGATAVTPWDLRDPLRGGGRGLLIVRALVERLDVEVRDAWTVVRCSFGRAPATGADDAVPTAGRPGAG